MRPAASGFTGHRQFVSGEEHRHADSPVHRDPLSADGRDQSDILRTQTRSRGDHRVTGADVDAGATYPCATLRHVIEGDAIAVSAAGLLHDDCIGACRNRRPGKDAGCGARLQRHADVTGGNALAHAQRRPRRRHVECAHRVAVHL